MFTFLKKSGESISVNEVDELIGKINLIDIREEYEYQNGSIKGAKNIPMNKLLTNAEKYMNKKEKYYIMCQSGGRSGRTTAELSKMGFDVVDVTGGMGSYRGKFRV